ncbi:uncharacterized protein LOC143853438 [Tasmannia lanceolata]|uniref:uncharacterized protein LOC143853438 n=1 Tax=Tasmannia lanceolata TaxID=3420 RepID=UPI0040648F79
MGSETSSSPSGKRNRDPEDEIYLDNFHAHKRFLSEIMASSLNGLTVGDSLSENLMESPLRSEGMCNPRDEVTSQYSPMSEDSDDSRYCDTPLISSPSQSDTLGNLTNLGSPHRYQKPLVGFSSTVPSNSHSSLGCCLTTVACCQPRRGPDSEGRFPSSPSDMYHSADLRRAALLRSVQMRTQPQSPPTFELPFGSGQDTMQNIETAEERPCSYVKPLVYEREYQNSARVPIMLLDECSSIGLSESESNQEKLVNFSMKSEESEEELFGGNQLGRTGIVSSRRRSLLAGNASRN